MNRPDPVKLEGYYQAAETWSEDRARESARSTRTAWLVAGAACLIAVLEAVALVILLPLKQIAPYAVLVDKQTGNVEKLDLAGSGTITPDDALIRSMLAQYVSARESFDINALQVNYRKVALWSTGEARNQYIGLMQANNPSSPLAVLPRSAVLSVDIRSISNLGPETALVRFAINRSDGGAQPVSQGVFAAVVKYRFTSAGMSAASRLDNPLGFQVLHYSKSQEVESAVPAAPAPSVTVVPVQQAPAVQVQVRPAVAASGRPATTP